MAAVENVDATDARRDNNEDDSTDARGQRLPQMKESDFLSTRYKMDYPNRGMAVIINNYNFDSNTRMDRIARHTDDATEMYRLLDSLGFEQIQSENNLSASEIRRLLQKVAEDDHTNNDCFVCVILTRGEEGYIFARDDKIPVDELVQPFKGDKCLSLAGKPKLFFIQSHRSTQLYGRMAHDGPYHSRLLQTDEEVVIRRIPTEADIFMTYAVIPENPDTDYWFIRAVVDVFDLNWKTMDLLTMITRANKKVATEFESHALAEFDLHKRQIPCITSMLTKDLYFTAK